VTATQIYLASTSPRRRELLEQIGIRYAVVKVDVDEAWDGCEEPGIYAMRLALEKAQAGVRTTIKKPLPVMGADTVVVLDNQVLGKPANREHGIAMLAQLSGRSHQVVTAVAVINAEHQATRLSISQVRFSSLTPEICAAYWETGEACDKAGGYAIQGRAAALIAHLEGSYSGVMGLPLFETAELLAEFGINTFSQ
jgi:septum formation protein